MSKLSKAESARLNGAKSKGPVTPEGKAKSSKNAITHGFYSNLMVLDTEEEGAYCDLSELLLTHYKPRNVVEEDLVRDMVDARWRLNRIKGMEKSAINLQMAIQYEEVKVKFKKMDTPTQTTLAAVELVDTSQLLTLLQRLETKFTRLVHRTIELLAKLQSDMPPSQLNGPSAPSESAATTISQAAVTSEPATAESGATATAPLSPQARRPHFLTAERYAARTPKAIPQSSQRSIDLRNEPNLAFQSTPQRAAEPENLRYFQAA